MRSTFGAIFGMSAVGSGANPIHDFSQQEKGFGTMSAFIDASTRLSLIVETATNNFQFQTSPATQSGRWEILR